MEKKTREQELEIIASSASLIFERKNDHDACVEVGRVIDEMGYRCAIFTDDGKNLHLEYVTMSRRLKILGKKLTGLDAGDFSFPHAKYTAYQRILSEKKAFLLKDSRDQAKDVLSILYEIHGELDHFLAKGIGSIVDTVITRLFPDVISMNINCPVIVDEKVKGFIAVLGSALVEQDVPTIGILAQILGSARNNLSAEAALKERERSLSAFFEAIMDTVLLLDTDGMILSINKVGAGRFNSRPDEMVGKCLYDFLSPELTESRKSYFQKVFDSGKPMEFEDSREGLDLIAYVYPVFDSLGNVEKIAIYANDVTEKKKAEDKIREQESFAIVGRVAGKIAHDFNNVLSIITGTSQLLQTRDLPEDVMREVDIILESAFTGRDLTSNLLLFAKDQEPSLSRFDLNEKINTLLEALRSDMENIEVSVSAELWMEELLADSGLLGNALINMIQNSIHAMSKTDNPLLEIRTFSEGESVCIEIEDNGCGVPTEYIDKIFEPAVTLKGGRDRTGAYKRGIKGSGYGMANVKRCVDKHGGAIEFESEVDKGTKVKISLPLIKGHFTEEEARKIRKWPVVEGKRILIVEDEPHLGRVLYSLLSEFDHSIDLVTDGKTAIDYFNGNVYDAVSLDFLLPDLNGMEVYERIRETNKDVPIIFVSCNFEFMKSMIDLKKEDSRVDHLAKPFENVDYVSAIHKWLVD